MAISYHIMRLYSHTRNVVWIEVTGHFWAILTPTLRDPPSNCFFGVRPFRQHPVSVPGPKRER